MDKTKLFFAGLLMLLCLNGRVFCIEPVNPNLDPTARKVLNYLESVYQKKTLSGYNVYVHTPDDYEQTGMQAAVWGRDIRWLGDAAEMAAHAKRHRYILTLHWHWFFDGQSAWKNKREEAADVGRMVTPGTAEHAQAMKEIGEAADKLEVFQKAGIPVLWRPLHEIDGGWFWWTDTEKPENTAQLWRMMYDYMTNERKLNNLIWVYSAGVGKKTTEYRKRFYPGAKYVDISGIDVYGVDFRTDVDKYKEYYDAMAEVSPGKMLACGECDAIPDPEKMKSGELPRWLYAMPWWGAPSHGRPVDWAVFTMRHDFILTLDEIPAFGTGNIAPHTGIVNPRDDGTAWYTDSAPKIDAYAVDRDGTVREVTFYANGQRIGSDKSAPYSLVWSDAKAGGYEITARAVDNDGEETISNKVRMSVGLADLARGKSVTASSGETAENAVDGDYHTVWASNKNDKEWIYVDLGKAERIDSVNLFWGWKIHAEEFSLEVAVNNPENSGSWSTVHKTSGRKYQTWEAADRIRFAPTSARYVRLSAFKRAGGQNWGGYQLAAFEIPVIK